MKRYQTWGGILTGLVLLVMAYLTVARLPPPRIQEFLQEHTVDLLHAHLVLILCALLFQTQRHHGLAFPSGWRCPAPLRWHLTVFLTGGILLTATLAPQTHRIFYDEDIYQGIAMNMAFEHRAQMCNDGVHEYGLFHCHRGEYNKQPNGYPFLIATVFRLTGINENATFFLNNVLLGVAMAVVFLIALHLFGNPWAGLFAALITALTPQNLHWFNTAAAEPSSTVSAALVVLAGLHATRNKDEPALILLAGLTSFCLNIRPENGLILIVLAAIFLGQWPQAFREPRFYLFVWLVALLALPVFMHALLVRNNPWGSDAAPFALHHFMDNLKVNLSYYWDNRQFPLLFTLLAMTGWHHRRRLGELALLWLWFFLFFGIFLFFYAGRYDYGADIRFSLPSHLPLALLAGIGAERLGHALARRLGHPPRLGYALVTLVLILSFIPFLPQVRAVTSEAWAARADHRFAREMARQIPDDALVLTHNPAMFHLWGKNAAQVSLALEDTEGTIPQPFLRAANHVYFHYNFWCNVDDPLQSGFCTRLLQRYRHELVVEYQERNNRFALYRIFPREDGKP
ncbi:MAG: glycosyltransferase family 39 protein [Magnetococcales bacterium]|nr:glycosyltransferase family 39 protein [Magnetococcales bacterium]